MPQIVVNSTNIENFGWAATFNPYNQSILFDTSELTTYETPSGSGALYVSGICFSVIDQQGVVLLEPDWDNPQIQPALGETEYTLDLSSIGVDFFFQTYKIIGYIKDGDGQIYQTTQINPKICQPTGLNENGYVDGTFQVTANCPDNVLTIKEVTSFVYNNTTPDTVTKSGSIYYPTGTISAISFTGTPFTNNIIYNGQYRVVCTTSATYSLGNDIYVTITYYTNNTFDLTCANKLQDIICCIISLQKEKIANCNNAKGQRAEQLEAQITIPFLTALTKEISGQDASAEVLFIKKTLNCNCGGSSIIRNEFSPLNNEPNPIDPTVTTIVLNGIGGTTVPTPTINGNTKTYNITSSVYQVVKTNTGDQSFTITVDTSVLNTVKYKIAINYTVLSQTILNTISGDSALLSMFNSLVNVTNFNVDLSNLNGKCIVDISGLNYFASYKAPSSATTLYSVNINGEISLASPEIQITDTAAIETFLNSVGYGTFSVSYSSDGNGNYINILTTSNANQVNYVVFNIQPTLVTVPFQKTSLSLIGFLQAVVDYICSITALEVALGSSKSFSYIDYNGETITVNLSESVSQDEFNSAVTYFINSLQAVNTIFESGLTRTLGIVKLGGTILQDTNILLNGYNFKVYKDNDHYVIFNNDYTLVSHRAGSSGTDIITRNISSQSSFTSIGATVADIAAVSYYAKAILSADASGEFALIGSYYPYSDDGGVSPAPAIDPNKTAYILPQEGRVDYYAKNHIFAGTGVASFDMLLGVQRLTTAERDAIDAGLLIAGLVIFNTTVSKGQMYDGSVWNNLW